MYLIKAGSTHEDVSITFFRLGPRTAIESTNEFDVARKDEGISGIEAHHLSRRRGMIKRLQSGVWLHRPIFWQEVVAFSRAPNIP